MGNGVVERLMWMCIVLVVTSGAAGLIFLFQDLGNGTRVNGTIILASIATCIIYCVGQIILVNKLDKL